MKHQIGFVVGKIDKIIKILQINLVDQKKLIFLTNSINYQLFKRGVSTFFLQQGGVV